MKHHYETLENAPSEIIRTGIRASPATQPKALGARKGARTMIDETKIEQLHQDEKIAYFRTDVRPN